MHLKNVGIVLQQRWDDGTLIGTGGHNDVVSFDPTVRRLRDKSVSAIAPSECNDGYTAANWSCDEGGISRDEFHYLAASRETVGISVRERKIRQLHRPVRKLKPQTVPALRSPALGDPVALKHEMLAASLG